MLSLRPRLQDLGGSPIDRAILVLTPTGASLGSRLQIFDSAASNPFGPLRVHDGSFYANRETIAVLPDRTGTPSDAVRARQTSQRREGPRQAGTCGAGRLASPACRRGWGWASSWRGPARAASWVRVLWEFARLPAGVGCVESAPSAEVGLSAPSAEGDSRRHAVPHRSRFPRPA
jgi:hypothetical protein